MTKIHIDRVHGGASDGVLDFSASVNPLGPPPEALRAYLDGASRIDRYPDPYASKLRDALARRHSIPLGSILVHAGSTPIFDLLADVVAPKRPVVVIPTFSEIANALLVRGIAASAIVLDPAAGFAWPDEEVMRALRSDCDALFFGRPNSPTGTLVGKREARAIAEDCVGRGACCVIDEAFIDFVGEEESLVRDAVGIEGLVVVRSLTKLFAIPGLRVGYAVAHPRTVGELRRRQFPWSVSAPAESVAVACLATSASYVERTLEVVAEGRARLAEGLARAGVTVFPSVANFLLVFDPKAASPQNGFKAKLERHGIAVRDLGALPGLSPGFFRVAVRLPNDNEKLLLSVRTSSSRRRSTSATRGP